MRYNDYQQKIAQLQALIEQKETGPSKTIAKTMGVSPASFFRYLNELRNMGEKIEYCKQQQSYIYVEDDSEV